MIHHMRHGSPPRLMAPQAIDGCTLRKSHPAPSAGNRMSRISGLMGSPPGVVDVDLTALDLRASSPAVVLACSRDLEFDGAQAGERRRDARARLDKDGSGAGPGRHHMACAQAAGGMRSVV